MNVPERWYPPLRAVPFKSRLVAAALAPAGALYDLGGALRFAVAQPFVSRIPVICIGNLTAGGTGKTPLAITIARHFSVLRHRPFVLTRGYGGSLAGPIQVDLAMHTAAQTGDEALLLAQAAPTIVAKDRAAGARLAEELGAGLLVMDDGFQNPAIKSTLSFIVVDGEVGLGNARVIPAGPLRESSARGFKRADALIVMGAMSQRTQRQIAGWKGATFHASLAPSPGQKFAGKYYAFAGIGRPDKFFQTLRSHGVQLVGNRAFADHHAYSTAEFEEMREHAKALGALLITTAKDAARLSPKHRNLVEVLSVAVQFGASAAFGSFLMERLTSAPQNPKPSPASVE